MKKRLLRLIPAALALAALWGCAAGGGGPEDGAYRIWFSALDDRSARVAVGYELRQLPEDQPPVEALMEELLTGPEGQELTSPFPTGARLLGWSLEAGELHLDLSGQYGGLTGVDLTVADACLALTLCQAPGVESVYVTVEGGEVPYRPIQQVGRSDILFPTDRAPEETAQATRDPEAQDDA